MPLAVRPIPSVYSFRRVILFLSCPSGNLDKALGSRLLEGILDEFHSGDVCSDIRRKARNKRVQYMLAQTDKPVSDFLQMWD